MINLEDIKRARKTIQKSIKKTVIVDSSVINEMTQTKVYFKLENLQRTGSFKARGALNKIANLTKEEKEKGIIASSAGNHAQGVALGAKEQGLKATIVMPETAPLTKVVATKSYGAKIVQSGTVYDHAYAKALEIQKKEGSTFIHPFNDDYVIAGQGTIGLEILEELNDVDAIIIPVGGGGLLAGISVAVKSLKKDVLVIGVETENIPSMSESLKEHKVVQVPLKVTVADGIAVRQVGEKTYDIVKDYVDDIVTVSEDEIAIATLYMMEKVKVIAEASGATPLAAILSKKLDYLKGKKVVCLVSGGNVDVNNIEKIVNKAQILLGRRTELLINLKDRTGELNKVTTIFQKEGANVLYLNQTRFNRHLEINEQELHIVLECRDKKHRDKIIRELKKEEFKVKVI